MSFFEGLVIENKIFSGVPILNWIKFSVIFKIMNTTAEIKIK